MNKDTLIIELKEAYQLASRFKGGYSGEFFDSKDFAEALRKAIELFEGGDNSSARDLWLWFTPTTAWDDFVGLEGADLGNSIFEKLDQYIKENKIEI